jgi:IS30 family transposase
VIYAVVNDFDLAQRKYEKQQSKTKRNDLTLEIKERIKEYLHQELSPEQIVGVLLEKRIVMCVHRVYLSTYLER